MAQEKKREGQEIVENSVKHIPGFKLLAYNDGEKINQAAIERELDRLLEDALLEGERDLS